MQTCSLKIVEWLRMAGVLRTLICVAKAFGPHVTRPSLTIKSVFADNHLYSVMQ